MKTLIEQFVTQVLSSTEKFYPDRWNTQYNLYSV